MANAIFDTVQADIQAGNYIFKANGSKIKFSGFMKVYVEDSDEQQQKEYTENILPLLQEGEILELKKLDPKQSFTQPPRYTEASLIKAMEKRVSVGQAPMHYHHNNIGKRVRCAGEKGAYQPSLEISLLT